jgi:glycogen debranching enzyme
MNAVDFSLFQAHDSLYLSYIYEELGDKLKADYWKKEYEVLKEKINASLWCEEDGLYYDKLIDGDFNKVVTPACFMPMFANIASKEQAEKLVRNLTDENLLWTKVPLSTVAKTHPSYSTDMWRGGVWLNLNYFVIKGLLNYGYEKEARELAEKTILMFGRDIEKYGKMHEYYDGDTCEGVHNLGFQSWNLLVNNMIADLEGRIAVEEF